MADAPRYGRRRRGDDDAGGAGGAGDAPRTTSGWGKSGDDDEGAGSGSRMGWGGGGGGAGEAKGSAPAGASRSSGAAAAIAGQAKPSARMVDDNDDDEVMPMIPDLEEDAEEDIVQQVAEAPVNTGRRFQTLSELNDSIRFSLPSSIDGLDLSVLTGYLLPLETVEERDEEWEFDKLLQGIGNEMQAEADAAAEAAAAAAAKPAGLKEEEGQAVMDA